MKHSFSSPTLVLFPLHCKAPSSHDNWRKRGQINRLYAAFAVPHPHPAQPPPKTGLFPEGACGGEKEPHNAVNNFPLPQQQRERIVAMRDEMSSGPSTGVEIFVPGRQDLFARRIPIPSAGAPDLSEPFVAPTVSKQAGGAVTLGKLVSANGAPHQRCALRRKHSKVQHSTSRSARRSGFSVEYSWRRDSRPGLLLCRG